MTNETKKQATVSLLIVTAAAATLVGLLLLKRAAEQLEFAIADEDDGMQYGC